MTFGDWACNVHYLNVLNMTGCDDDDDAYDELNWIALSQIGLSFFVLCSFLKELTF